jgi:chaperonin GroEL (HSP60 family)
VAVRAASKDIFFGQDSRAAMQAGIDKLADSVGVTLGPRGMEHEIGTAEVALSTTIRRFW